MGQVVDALERSTVSDGRPVAIIANTVKGQGVSFAAGRFESHTKVPSDEELRVALAELGEPATAGEDGR
jgi:transketolase